MERIKNIQKVYWYLFLVIAIAAYFLWKNLAMQHASQELVPLSNIKKVTDNQVFGVLPNISYYYELAGEVKHPGVYSATSNVLIQDAISLAGGLTNNADLDYVYRYISLAVKVKPEQKIYIPSKNLGLTTVITSNQSSLRLERVNINYVSTSQLEEISGVGPATAQKIISGRPYQACEDINKLKGVSKTTKENIMSVCEL